MKINRILIVLVVATTFMTEAWADTRPRILVNKDITTHIMMPENIRLVDISTERVVGDQCADNMLRIKPLTDSLLIKNQVPDGEFLGTVTLIGERHMAQYDLVYSMRPMSANSLIKVKYDETANYSNPDIPMTEGEMANYAWAISHKGRKYNMIRSKSYGITAQVYNIYSIGNFFFIDLALDNNTKIQYDIAQMRITLADKKEVKATNSQTLELSPAFVLNKNNSFKKHYRQVIVLPKLTYPEEKVLNIEISEDQISGRVINIPIQYEDILNADTFEGDKEDAYERTRDLNNNLYKQVNNLKKEIKDLQKKLDKANLKLNRKSARYAILEKKVNYLDKLNKGLAKMIDLNPVSLADSESETEDINKNANSELFTLDDN